MRIRCKWVPAARLQSGPVTLRHIVAVRADWKGVPCNNRERGITVWPDRLLSFVLAPAARSISTIVILPSEAATCNVVSKSDVRTELTSAFFARKSFIRWMCCLWHATYSGSVYGQHGADKLTPSFASSASTSSVWISGR